MQQIFEIWGLRWIMRNGVEPLLLFVRSMELPTIAECCGWLRSFCFKFNLSKPWAIWSIRIASCNEKRCSHFQCAPQSYTTVLLRSYCIYIYSNINLECNVLVGCKLLQFKTMLPKCWNIKLIKKWIKRGQIHIKVCWRVIVESI